MRWTTEVQISPTEMEKLRNSAIKTSTSLQFLPSTEGMNKRKMIRANGSAKYLTHHDSLYNCRLWTERYLHFLLEAQSRIPVTY